MLLRIYIKSPDINDKNVGWEVMILRDGKAPTMKRKTLRRGTAWQKRACLGLF